MYELPSLRSILITCKANSLHLTLRSSPLLFSISALSIKPSALSSMDHSQLVGLCCPKRFHSHNVDSRGHLRVSGVAPLPRNLLGSLPSAGGTGGQIQSLHLNAKHVKNPNLHIGILA